MIAFYRLVMSLAYAAVYPFGRLRAGSGRELWRGRLGLLPELGPCDAWLHAASVGEARVISYLVDYLKERQRDIRIHVTVMTETGFRTAVRLLPSDVTVTYFPFDASATIKRTLDRIRPRAIVIAETEIWPNLIEHAADRSIPVILVNGRMSAKGFHRYGFVKRSLRRLLSKYDRFFLKSENDFEKFASFGVDESRAVVCGDMKFDAPVMARSEGRIREIRHRAGVTDDEFLLVAGSTRPGEEKLLLHQLTRCRQQHEGLRLLIAPRHVERASEIVALLNEQDIGYYVYGEQVDGKGVILVNQMGILDELYLAADLAFVGGTLVDVGGHNILEPVWAGTPALFGPSLSNVREAADYIVAHDYGAMVSDADDLGRLINEVVTGARRFATKTDADLSTSATALAGDYILDKLKHV